MKQYKIVDDAFGGSYGELMTREEIEATERYWREESPEHPFDLVWSMDETEVRHREDDGSFRLIAHAV